MGHFYAAVVLCKNFAKKKKIVYNITRLARPTAHTYYTNKVFTRFVKPVGLVSRRVFSSQGGLKKLNVITVYCSLRY